MQSSNEELETSNEELQSTIEELQTTNEELQSTNEELETMNEELQSTNEAIESTNSELRQRTHEVNEALALQGSILSSIRYGLVVMDRNYNVVIWNHEAEELWGLRADEVKGQSFFNLDIGLPVHDLAGIIRNAVGGDGNPPSGVIVDATNRRGRNFKCQVTASPRLGPQGERQGIILTMEEYQK
jgi:two-component system CheB/CheR fusion protein